MLPSTVVYLVYLIVVTATGESAFPLISIIMLAAIYGLQVCEVVSSLITDLMCALGDYLPPEAGVHADRLDGRVHPIVSLTGR